MTAFQHTEAALDFIATANSRETSREIMEAIVSFAKDADEAAAIWDDGIGNWDADNARAFVNRATRDGRLDAADLVWGAAGSGWIPAEIAE